MPKKPHDSVKFHLTAAIFLACSPAFAACTLSVQASLPNGTVGQYYSGSISASATCPGTITYGIAGLPGVSVDPAAGVVSGVPGVSEPNPFIVTVSATEQTQGPNSVQLTANMTYSVLIGLNTSGGGGGLPLSCTLQFTSPSTLTAGVVNQPYWDQLMWTFLGCHAPYTWAIVSQLPPGLTLTPGSGLSNPGEISGTPTVAGSFDFTLMLTSSDSVTATKQFSIQIAAASSGPGVIAAPPGPALPHFAAQDVWTNGIIVMNTGDTAANFGITFYNDSGNRTALPFSSGATSNLSATLPPLGSAYYEASNPAAGLIEGWGQITADPAVVVQSLFREDSAGTYYEAAVPSATGTQEFEIPFDATTFALTGDQFFTGFAIANLDELNTAVLTCTARDLSGAVIPDAFTTATGPPPLNPLGHWAGYLFPALTGERGTIDCTSNTQIAAVALRFIGDHAFSSLPVINKPAAAASAISALPHFAAQDVWTTGIFVINTGAAPANFAIAFYDGDGQPVALPFGGGATNNLSATLPPLGAAYYEASDPAALLITGWGQITADPSIVVQALFRENVNGTYYEAAVPSNAGSKEFEIPFDATKFAATGESLFTGFAIANLDPANSAAIACTARDSSGTVIPNAFTSETGPPTLKPLGHWAGYLFPALTGQRGTIDCVSNVNVSAIALRFLGTNAFSSLPVIDK